MWLLNAEAASKLGSSRALNEMYSIIFRLDCCILFVEGNLNTAESLFTGRKSFYQPRKPRSLLCHDEKNPVYRCMSAGPVFLWHDRLAVFMVRL